MIAVLEKELRQYFNAIMGYVFLSVFLFICGYHFVAGNLILQRNDIGRFFNSIMVTVMFLIPMITMRLFAEERKTKTDQLLLTCPVSITSIVMGKYLAALAVIAVGLMFTLPYPIILIKYGNADIWVILGNYLGFTLALSAFISIGIFISSLTESQVIAAVVSYTVLIGLWLVGLLYPSVNNEALKKVLKHLSLYNKYYEFSIGIFNPASAVYYLTISAVFIFLTVRIIDQRRWN